jgi:hypothetical protein
MLLWIYPILASRFVTILGKKMRAKRQQSLKKDRNRSFSTFDTNLVKRERTVTEREGKKALWKGALKRQCQFGLRDTEPSSHVQPNAVSSCPTWSLFTSPMRRSPTRRGPTRQHGNGQLNGNPPVRASSEGFRQRLGENWGKTNELGKTEYN